MSKKYDINCNHDMTTTFVLPMTCQGHVHKDVMEKEVPSLEEERSGQGRQQVQGPGRRGPCVFLKNRQESSVAKAE